MYILHTLSSFVCRVISFPSSTIPSFKLTSSCVQIKILVFWFFNIVHFIPLITRISTHIPYTRDLYRRRAYFQTLHFVLLAHALVILSILYMSFLIAHCYSHNLPFEPPWRLWLRDLSNPSFCPLATSSQIQDFLFSFL